MTAVTTARLDREQFISWLADAMSGQSAFPDRGSKRAEKLTDVTLAWPTEQPRAHPVICVPQSQFQDLFAFVSTYTKLRPFTAFFRVLPLELVNVLERDRGRLEANLTLAKCVAGAAMAEAWITSARDAERSPNAFPLLLSSLSAALGQAVLAGYDEAAFDWVAGEWFQAIRRNSHPTSEMEGAIAAWRTVLALNSFSPVGLPPDQLMVAEFIKDAISERGVRPSALQRLAPLAGGVDLPALLAATREERIERFNEVIADFKRRNQRGFRPDFLAGLMLAIAGNGAFEMLRSAREFDGWLDGAITWFGICAALFEESNVLTYANSAGRVLLRDMLNRDDPFELPRSDVSSSELRFFEGSDPFEQFAARTPSSLDVEILPNVIGRIAAPALGNQTSRIEEVEMVLRSLDDIGYIADRARRLLYNSDLGDRQGTLFKPSKRSRSR